jgi:hypothetical protein
MNRILILLCLALLSLFGCKDDEKRVLTLDCLSNNLQNGIIAFYPFSNGSLIDESGNNYNLTNPSGALPTMDRDGNTDCAYQFFNSQTNDDFLTTTNTSFLNNLDEFSVSIWYEPLDSNRLEGIYETLLSRDLGLQCPDRYGQWSVGLYDCRRVVFSHGNSVRADNVTNLTDGCIGEVYALTQKWHHVVAVKNNDTYKLYFNGNLEETVTGPANCGNNNTVQDIGDLFIGKLFIGRMDDILIYDRELSPTEVTDLMNLESCCE